MERTRRDADEASEWRTRSQELSNYAFQINRLQPAKRGCDSVNHLQRLGQSEHIRQVI